MIQIIPGFPERATQKPVTSNYVPDKPLADRRFIRMTIDMEAVQIRQQFDFAYTELLSQFISISKPHLTASVLNELKNKYSDVINSTRTSEYIKSIEGLLKILEKRGALSYNNIEVLNYISSTYVRDQVLERTLRTYEGQSRPTLPPHNRYLMQSGKYTKNRPTQRKSSNHRFIPDVHRTENANESLNRVSEMPARSRTPSEDFTTPETEFFIENYVPALLVERRNVVNDLFTFAKVRHKFSSKCGVGIMVASIWAALLVVSISMYNILCVEPPATARRFETQPGPSGSVFNNASQMHRLPMQVTMYTTQPTFRITLPGSLHLGSTNQRPTTNESEVMTMVLQELSERLGRNWRDVARFLRVTEHDIDEIESQLNLTLKEKALKALFKFQSKCDPLQWKPKLKQALDKARRRDLMELVDELSSRQF